ncbi:MAG: ORF6N domain-containing protein [Nanoarchaeota archaeon]|nr:ORF6N domain-containing protein [Nanoarchaeota archaeon]
MNKEVIIHPENIKDKIHLIRGLQVMLDRDLAELYDVKAIRLREQVKRNIGRFPLNFMFRLNNSEINRLVSQNAIPSKKHLGGFSPYVFTEQGVAMLSSVLKSNTAVKISIQIINAFVAMRRFIALNAQIFQRLDRIEIKQVGYDEKFETLFKTIENKQIKPKQGIFFNGQIFDAYSFVSDLIRSANKSILLIDNYVDDSVLTLFSKRKKDVSVTIYTKEITKQLKLDLDKFNSQYQKIEIKEFKESHDRFLIIDNKEMYHIGASLKDLGKKWFAFSKFDKEVFNLLNKL